MQTTLRCVSLLALLAVAGTTPAQEKFDSAARAKTIAPFIAEQTILVVHADLSRVKIGRLFDELVEWMPEMKREIDLPKMAAAGVLSSFAQAGGKEVYVLLSLADVSMAPPHELPLTFIVPLPEGSDGKAMATVLGAIPLEAKERLGGVFFVGSRAALERVKQGKPEVRPELARAFEAAGDSTAQVLLLPPKYARRVIEELMPTLPKVIGEGPSTIITDGLLWAAAGIDPPPRLSLRVAVQSKSPQAATALKNKWADICRAAREDVEDRDLLPQYDEVVKVMTPEVQGDRLVLLLDEKNNGIAKLLAALKPAVEKARDAARQAESANSLRQIGMAMLTYEEKHKRLPAAALYDANGKPLLSWRVQLLPFLGQEKLYEQFHLNEPWDSEHNRKLIDQMPDIYRSPAAKLKEKGRTTYVVPVGKDTVFSGREGLALKDIKNPSGTILVVEADGEHAVIWTKPDDLPFDPEKPTRGLTGPYQGGFLAILCDGRVEFVPNKQEGKSLRGMFTRGGE